MTNEIMEIEIGRSSPISEVFSQKIADYARKGLEGATNTQRAYKSDIKYFKS